MLGLLLLVVVLAVVAIGAAGSVAASREGGPHRSLLGGAGPALVLLTGVVAVVVTGAAVVSVVGLRGDGGTEAVEAATRPSAAPAPVERQQTPAPLEKEPPDRRPPRPAGDGPEVWIAAGGPPTVIDRLPDGAVLIVNATGFQPGPGEVAQCGIQCLNGFPVEFGADGGARFQYLVSDRVHEGERCGARQRPCLLVVSGPQDKFEGLAYTVFHDPAPPAGRVTVEPHGGLADGDVVTVTASGFPAATPLRAAQCTAGTEVVAGGCRPATVTRTGSDGAATVRLTVGTGEVDGVACGPRRLCSIRVTVEAPVAPVTVPVTFSMGPSARYQRGKLAIGLVLAALLLAMAWRLVRTTDWREPAAAATPEMDQAVLDA